MTKGWSGRQRLDNKKSALIAQCGLLVSMQLLS